MQARVFHIHEAPVTLCPLIYKAQCSAESFPPGPPIKFNGLSAMTSKSLAVQLFANNPLCRLSAHTHPFFILSTMRNTFRERPVRGICCLYAKPMIKRGKKGTTF